MRTVVVIGVVLGLARIGAAQPAATGVVALLPLDADQRLELYGQPVASEIARALVAGNIDVVVVGPKMAVPDRARLIVDGSLSATSDVVTISIRVRKRIDGTVLDTLTAVAPLATIDKAASELSTRLLPSVRQKLAGLDLPVLPAPVQPPKPAPVPAKPRPLLVAVVASTGTSPTVEPLRHTLEEALDGLAVTHQREPRRTVARDLARATVVKTVAAAHADLAIVFEVAGYDVTPGIVPMARARVRVRIADASSVVFDRVVVTDTVVGDKAMPADKLAGRVGAEILAILQPHLHRLIGGW